MAPAGGKVSPAASNAPISARVPQSSTDQDADATAPRRRETPSPSLRGQLDDERRLAGGTTSARGVCATLGMIRV